MSDDAERTTRRLLASLDGERYRQLSDTYQGDPPTVLCSACFNPTASTINSMVASAKRNGVTA